MANNRAYLVCVICAEDPSTTLAQCRHYLMKYRPSQGWYVPQDDRFCAQLNAWLDQHKHGDMYGEFIQLMDEYGDPAAHEKRTVLAALGGKFGADGC